MSDNKIFLMTDTVKVVGSMAATTGIPLVMWLKDVGTPFVIFVASIIGLGAAYYNFKLARQKYINEKNKENEGDK